MLLMAVCWLCVSLFCWFRIVHFYVCFCFKPEQANWASTRISKFDNEASLLSNVRILLWVGRC